MTFIVNLLLGILFVGVIIVLLYPFFNDSSSRYSTDRYHWKNTRSKLGNWYLYNYPLFVISALGFIFWLIIVVMGTLILVEIGDLIRGIFV